MTGRLVLLSGLLGVGKSTLGRALAAATGGVHPEGDAMVARIQSALT